MREVLDDDDLLAALLVIRPISVRRYAKGDRHCSDSFAARLHWLALLIYQLEGFTTPMESAAGSSVLAPC